MKRMLLVLCAALSLARFAAAQPIDAGAITAGGSDCSVPQRCAAFPLPLTTTSVTLTVSGTYSATLQFEASADSGTTWFAIAGTLLSDGSSATSTTSTGQYAFSNSGLTTLRVRASAYSSGTAVITAVRGFAPQRDGTLTTVTPGTAAANLGKAEDAASASGDTGVGILGVRNEAAAQLTSADGDYGNILNDAYGALMVRQDHPKRFHCVVTVSTATTIQAVGGSCAAPGAGLSLYVTDIYFTASASGIAADAFPTLKYGTGGTCGTGTAVFWQNLSAAAVTAVDNRSIPIKIPANNEICWITTTAGSKAIQISGFIAP